MSNKPKVGFMHAEEGYVAPELCPFGSKRCLCQWCMRNCNNGFNCAECRFCNKEAHDVWMCTGFVGIYPEGYTSDWVEEKSEELLKEEGK